MQLTLGIDEHVVFDLETTGLSSWADEVIEIGAVKVFGDEIDEKNAFHFLVNPKRPIPPEASRVNGITDEMVQTAPTFDQILPKFLEYVGDAHLVAQNAKFDMGFISKYLVKYGIRRNLEVYDTVIFSRKAFPGESRHNLDMICQRLEIKYDPAERHRSIGDVMLTAKAFVRLRERLGGNLPPREKWSV